MSQYQRGPVYQESLGSPGCCSVGCSVRVCRPAFPTPPARRPSAPPTRSPRTCPRPTCRQSSSLRSVHTCPQPILTLDQITTEESTSEGGVKSQDQETISTFEPTRNINSDVSANCNCNKTKMCDAMCSISRLTYYSDVSQFSRRSFSNPVPSKRGAFTLARSPGGCRKEGEKKERSLVG